MAKELPEWMPSPPGRPGKYALYISRHRDDDTQCIVMIFCEAFAARKFLDVLLRDDGVVWDDDCTIRSETGIVVSTRWYPKRMRACVEHEYSLAEMGWSLPQPYLGYARRFRSGPEEPRTLEEDAGGTRAKERRERKASAPTASVPAGYIHVSDLALSMGIEPRQARAALRGVMQKPACGWNFPPGEIDDIKKKIKERLDE